MKLNRLAFPLVLAATLAPGGIGRAQNLADYVTVNGSHKFGTLDLSSGLFTQLGTTNYAPEDLTRLGGGSLYATDNANNLLTVNPATGTGTVVGNMGNAIIGAKYRPTDGTLFAFSHTQLFTVNPATAAVTLVGSFSQSSPFADLAFDNQGHAFFAIAGASSGNSTLYSLNMTNAQLTSLGAVGFRVASLDLENGVLYGFTDETTRRVISIDIASGAGTQIALQDAATGGTIYGAAAFQPVPEPTGLLILFAAVIIPATRARRRRPDGTCA
jgi:hypothetical protein